MSPYYLVFCTNKTKKHAQQSLSLSRIFYFFVYKQCTIRKTHGSSCTGRTVEPVTRYRSKCLLYTQKANACTRRNWKLTFLMRRACNLNLHTTPFSANSINRTNYSCKHYFPSFSDFPIGKRNYIHKVKREYKRLGTSCPPSLHQEKTRKHTQDWKKCPLAYSHPQKTRKQEIFGQSIDSNNWSIIMIDQRSYWNTDSFQQLNSL